MLLALISLNIPPSRMSLFHFHSWRIFLLNTEFWIDVSPLPPQGSLIMSWHFLFVSTVSPLETEVNCIIGSLNVISLLSRFYSFFLVFKQFDFLSLNFNLFSPCPQLSFTTLLEFGGLWPNLESSQQCVFKYFSAPQFFLLILGFFILSHNV